MTDQRNKTVEKIGETSTSFYRVMKTFFWRPPFKKIILMILVLLGIEVFLLLTFFQNGLIYTKGEEISFSALLELIFILFTIFLIDNVLEAQAKKREDHDRWSVHKAAIDDVRFIFDQIYSLIYEVLGASTVEQPKNGSATRERGTEVKTTAEDDSVPSILTFILDMAIDRELVVVIAGDIQHKKRKNMNWRTYLSEAVDDLHTEVENYQQRWGALLVAKETESEGSELMKDLSSIRRSLREIGRNLGYREDGVVRLHLSRRGRDRRYSLRIDDEDAEIEMFRVHDRDAGNPLMSFRKFYRAGEALRRGDGAGSADGGKDKIPAFPDELGGFMSGIDKRWLSGESGNDDEESVPRHARQYLDKLLRYPSQQQEPGWFNLVRMYKHFNSHPDEAAKKANSYYAACHDLLGYAAESGHVDAQHTFGMIHKEGRCGQKRPLDTAELWFRRAAERKHADAQYQLGLLFRYGDVDGDGDGPAKDVDQARIWFNCARNDGHGGAEFQIDLLKKRDSVAIDIWREGKDALSTEDLYIHVQEWDSYFFSEHYDRIFCNEEYLLEDEEVEKAGKEFDLHMEYYRKSAEGKHVAAQYELGRIYSEGIVLPYSSEPVRIIDIDVKKAAHWFLEIVRKPRIQRRHLRFRDKAAIALGMLYVQGRLGDESGGNFCNVRRRVGRWLSDDIRRKHGEAKGLLHSIAERDDKNTSLDAQYILGAIYREGICNEENATPRVEVDESEAKILFERAAKNGHVGAQNRLGVMLRDSCGKGCERCSRDTPDCNLKRAFEQFKAASEYDWRIMDRASKVEWFKMWQASKVEWWNARTNLGDMYDDGIGLSEKDDRELEPYDHFKRIDPLEDYSWEMPDPERELKLGVMYRDAHCVEQDPSKAFRGFCNAAQLVEEWNPEVAVRNLQAVRERERWSPEKWARFIREGKLKTDILLFVSPVGEITAHGRGVPTLDEPHEPEYRPDNLWSVAEYALGRIYEKGWGPRQESTELAEQLYKMACSRHDSGSIGHARSEYRLAEMYRREGRLDEARKWYERAATGRRDGGAGHAGAQFLLGRAYETGRGGVQPDREKAEKWYRKSAIPRWDDIRGNADAQFRLGRMYEGGLGGREPDLEEAERWYRKAAERRGENRPIHSEAQYRLGHSGAQYRLGRMCEDRLGGGEPDFEKAKWWYRKAAERRGENRPGHSEAQYRLGRMYERGLGGGEPDVEKAKCWYRKAAERRGENRSGHSEAQYRLGRMYERGLGGGEPDVEKAKCWYRKAAERRGENRSGHSEAQYRLGRMYERGLGGGEPDVEKAKCWYSKAADQGHVDALEWAVNRKDADPMYEYQLGVIWEEGRKELPSDAERARELYEKAIRKGNSDAMYRLGRMHQEAWENEKDKEGLKGAVKLYREADKKEHADSQYELGELTRRRFLRNGSIVPAPDAHECMYISDYIDEDWKNDLVEWYKKAARKDRGGNPDAQYLMGYHCSTRARRARRDWDRETAAHLYKEALDYYRLAAERGHRDAQFALAVGLFPLAESLFEGDEERKGLSESDISRPSREREDALKWYRKAAERRTGDGCGSLRHPGAAYVLGNIYAQGWCGVERNVREAEKWYQRAVEWYQRLVEARKNDRPRRRSQYVEFGFRPALPLYALRARYALGRMFEQGGKVSDAVMCYREVAEPHGDKGDAGMIIDDARYRLGRMYEQGWNGQERDLGEAVNWYEMIFREDGEGEGHGVSTVRLDALFRLGRMYEEGWNNHGPNREEAKEWYRRAVDDDKRGDEARADPQYRLGWMYERERNDRKPEPKKLEDFKKAKDLYLKAEKTRSDRNVRLPGLNESDSKARDELDPEARSSLQAQLCARYRLGMIYQRCGEKSANEKDAVNWYRKAAEPRKGCKGHDDAQYRLGSMYRYGHGVAKAEREAVEWMRRAAEQGHEKASKELARAAGNSSHPLHDHAKKWKDGNDGKGNNDERWKRKAGS